MKPVLIICTGKAPTGIRARKGDFPHWFRLGSGLRIEQVRVVDVVAGDKLPAPREIAGAIITGSASMVTEHASWSERCAGWVRGAMDADLPLFGVCFGHQLMAHALGGRVDYLPGGREIGTQLISLLPLGASDHLAPPETFRAHTTHEQSVLELPSGSRALARSARDPHQWVRYGSNAISTQFHPEFSAEIMRAYITRKHEDMRREGTDPREAFKAVAATPTARRLLSRFARHHGWTSPGADISPL